MFLRFILIDTSSVGLKAEKNLICRAGTVGSWRASFLPLWDALLGRSWGASGCNVLEGQGHTCPPCTPRYGDSDEHGFAMCREGWAHWRRGKVWGPGFKWTQGFHVSETSEESRFPAMKRKTLKRKTQMEMRMCVHTCVVCACVYGVCMSTCACVCVSSVP